MRRPGSWVLPMWAFLLLFGCGRSGPSKLPGQWEETMWNGAKGVATFSPDGSYRFESNPAPDSPKVVVTGVFREDADLLYLTFQKAQLQNLPPALQAHEKELTDKMSDAFDLGTENSANVTWNGKDAFVSVSSEGKKASFVRKR